MSDWSDDEAPSSKIGTKPTSMNNDGFGEVQSSGGGGRGAHRGRGGGRGGSFGDRGDRPERGNRDENGEREKRPGEWDCLSCSASNFASRTECFKCNEPKGDAQGAEGVKREKRPGEWDCLSCSASNFASRTECFKCNEPKGDAQGAEGVKREKRPGEWDCLSCSVSNFASRTECFKCNEPKGDAVGAEGDGTEVKRENYIPPEPTNDEAEMFGAGISAGINFDKFDKIEVSVTGNEDATIKPLTSFKDSKLRELLLENVEKSGYTKPTPIQKHAIPLIMAKRDLMGCAQTGSGKTAAFILPILNRIMDDNEGDTVGKPQCVVMAPTRELAIQIFDESRKFANRSWVKVAIAYGGTASRHQSDNIAKGCHVLIATPGRLMDFVGKGFLTFENLKFLVLDEADRMLDMGFKEKIQELLDNPTVEKENVQILMFSATFPEDIQRLAAEYLKNYVFLTVGIVGGASTDVDQEFIEVTKFQKRAKLGEILTDYCGRAEEDRILVFVETKQTADYLASFMSETKLSSTSIHGDRLQREREEALRDFRTGKRKVLVATSVAARGLDIKGVTHVINYDLPKDVQDYVHRIGRTGRVGNRGKSTSFFDPDNNSAIAGDLVKILKDANQPIPEFLSGFSPSSGGGASGFGGQDIRKGVPNAKPQEEEEEW